jgi:hypothetical protein
VTRTPSSPEFGFNHNIRHRGHLYHVQTEDSGINNPRVITHLFRDGGHIIKTLRTDYSDLPDDADRAGRVRELMKQQHKLMLKQLKEGSFDTLLPGDEQPATTLRGASSPTERAPLPPWSTPPQIEVLGGAPSTVPSRPTPPFGTRLGPLTKPASMATPAARGEPPELERHPVSVWPVLTPPPPTAERASNAPTLRPRPVLPPPPSPSVAPVTRSGVAPSLSHGPVTRSGPAPAGSALPSPRAARPAAPAVRFGSASLPRRVNLGQVIREYLESVEKEQGRG